MIQNIFKFEEIVKCVGLKSEMKKKIYIFYTIITVSTRHAFVLLCMLCYPKWGGGGVIPLLIAGARPVRPAPWSPAGLFCSDHTDWLACSILPEHLSRQTLLLFPCVKLASWPFFCFWPHRLHDLIVPSHVSPCVCISLTQNSLNVSVGGLLPIRGGARPPPWT